MEERIKHIAFKKKGRWGTLPADNGLWHTEHTSRYFAERFGVFREILPICVFETEWSNHMYVTERFEAKLHNRIREIMKQDPKGMEKLLTMFYTDRERNRKAIPTINPANLSALSNKELCEVYKRNRDISHGAVIYDQFTWLAEDFWPPLMDDVLTKKLGLVKDSDEYNDALFALIKPREISTTLEEKRAVIEKTLSVVTQKESLEDAADVLAKEYGWMPVLAYGTPWDAAHYKKEIEQTMTHDKTLLEKELLELRNYSQLRDDALNIVVKQYSINAQDLQVFIDFGLAIDARNEAEYVASVGGFYLLPLYDEILKRLNIDINTLRTFLEEEIIACLEGTSTVDAVRDAKGRVVAWFVDAETKSKINFSAAEGEELFNIVESQNAPQKSTVPIIKRGITASKGIVIGTARLVPSPEDNHKVQQGDILIAYSTMVDNLPAMKKAAAIVTESGGLTCHAAVVAREFGIPCIVSMKNAMSDFKDGQMLEVNADKGEVRII